MEATNRHQWVCVGDAGPAGGTRFAGVNVLVTPKEKGPSVCPGSARAPLRSIGAELGIPRAPNSAPKSTPQTPFPPSSPFRNLNDRRIGALNPSPVAPRGASFSHFSLFFPHYLPLWATEQPPLPDQSTRSASNSTSPAAKPPSPLVKPAAPEPPALPPPPPPPQVALATFAPSLGQSARFPDPWAPSSPGFPAAVSPGSFSLLSLVSLACPHCHFKCHQCHFCPRRFCFIHTPPDPPVASLKRFRL